MLQVVRFWDGDRFAVGVAQQGRTKIHVASITDTGVRKFSLLADEVRNRNFWVLDAPLKKTCRSMLKIGTRSGITDGAKAILKEGLADDAAPQGQEHAAV